ncbi:hypothetical protein CapIbe_020607 [Capra ibex]
MARWDQDDLSVPGTEGDLSGSLGMLFPVYDADTNMLYMRDPSLSPEPPPHLFNQTERLVAEDGQRPFSLLEEKASRLRKLVTQDKVQAKQLELEIRNLWMSSQRL